jgi:membrane protease YdiL (CAAX protease family)
MISFQKILAATDKSLKGPLTQLPLILIALVVWLAACYFVWKRFHPREEKLPESKHLFSYFLASCLMYFIPAILMALAIESMINRQDIILRALFDLFLKTAMLAGGLFLLHRFELPRCKYSTPLLITILVAGIGYMVLEPLLEFSQDVNQQFLINLGMDVPIHHMIIALSDPALPEIVFWTVAFSIVVVTPIYEEFLYRGFLQPTAISIFGLHGGILIQCLIFTGLHLHSTYLPIFVFAMALSYTRHWSGSLWPGILMHSFLNGSTILNIYFQHKGYNP